MTKIIPDATKLAAKRGFVRTAAQSLSAAIPTTAIAVTLSGDWLIGVGLGVAGAVATAVMAGAASYLDITSKGIPEAYADAALVSHLQLEDDEQNADEQAALARVTK